MTNQKIVVFGSIVQDLISYAEEFPRPGESVRGNQFLAGCGGKGANQAVAAARLFENVTMIGKVGNDIFGDANIDGLRKAGVNVDRIEKTTETSTATATITVNGKGENCIVVTLGANLLMNKEQADKVAHELDDAFIVMCQSEICQDGNKRIFEIAKEKKVITFFNPAPGDKSLDKSILSFVDIICTNENEAEFITGMPATTKEMAFECAKAMLKMGPSHAIITLGKHGVVYGSQDSMEFLTALNVEALDTTGAGDCFCGSFAALFSQGCNIRDAVLKAAGIASLSVTRKGTQSSYWKKEEIAAQYEHLL